MTKIIGGLGNQLFQYAAGRSLSLHHQTELTLDVSGFDDYKLRNFDLDAFHTVYRKARKEEIDSFCQRGLLEKIINRISSYDKRSFFRELYFHYNKNFLRYPAQTYLKGYWQSEKYFSPFKEIIRKDLSFKDHFISKVSDFANAMAGQETLSLHIRRGDFTNKEALNMHGLLSPDYYENALKLIGRKYKELRVLVFSDDINWVKENLTIKNAEFISGRISTTHFEDLYLMSLCKHNIIANSSFSWWGAWLNNNPEKIVIAPKNWFNRGPKDTYDLYPDGWIKI